LTVLYPFANKKHLIFLIFLKNHLDKIYAWCYNAPIKSYDEDGIEKVRTESLRQVKAGRPISKCYPFRAEAPKEFTQVGVFRTAA
jgi:hypothetical protein